MAGIVGRLLPPYRDGALLSRLGLVIGLIAAPLAIAVATGDAISRSVSSNVLLMVAARLLIGFGSV